MASSEGHHKVNPILPSASVVRPELLACRWGRRTSVIRSGYDSVHPCYGSDPLLAHPIVLVTALEAMP